jgi:catechol 2,3-dioxygenase-like lactoylglutathione lyase family enzyme
MSDFENGIGVIELFYEDLAAGRDFYQDVLGLPVAGQDETSAAFELGEVVVILNAMSSARELIGPRPIAGPHVGSRKCFTIGVPDTDAVCAELTGKGVQILAGPVNRPWGMRTAMFADPGGHLYEVAAEVPAPEVAAPAAEIPAAEIPADRADGGTVTSSWHKQIDVIELFYPDLAEAKAFYQDVFGLPVARQDATSVQFVMGEVLIILLGPASAAELIEPVPVASPETGARMCFTVAVPDVDAAYAELTGKGVQILGGPSNRSWGPYCIWFADPGGHVYEIVKARAPE